MRKVDYFELYHGRNTQKPQPTLSQLGGSRIVRIGVPKEIKNHGTESA